MLHRWRLLKGCQRPYKGRHLIKRVGAIKGPKHPQTKKKSLLRSYSLPRRFLRIFPLSQTHTHTHTQTQKNTSKSLDSSFSTKNTRYCSYTQSSSPWFYTLGFGVQECGCSFLAIIHTPNLLNLFPSIILLLCFNNMIY